VPPENSVRVDSERLGSSHFERIRYRLESSTSPAIVEPSGHAECHPGHSSLTLLQPRTPRRREHGAPPTTGVAEPPGQATSTPPKGPHLLGLALKTLDELALGPGDRQASDGCEVAPPRIQALLAMEVEEDRPTHDRPRDPETDPSHVPG